MKVFFDTEFTGLVQGTTLVSFGAVTEKGDNFYATLCDYDRSLVDDWLKENVLSNLKPIVDDKNFGMVIEHERGLRNERYTDITRDELKEHLEEWLLSFNAPIEMWGDCCAYDWVLFCDLWGTAIDVPKIISYIPRDLCTLLQIRGHDPDINREEFVRFKELFGDTSKHNALWDAFVIRMCYEKIVGEVSKDLFSVLSKKFIHG